MQDKGFSIAVMSEDHWVDCFIPKPKAKKERIMTFEKLFWSVCLILFVCPIVQAGDIPTDVLSTIKERAATEYPDDFSTQKYIIDQQIAAWQQLQGSVCPGVPEKVSTEIRQKASQDYPGDFSTQKYIMDEQCRAYKTISSFSPKNVPEAIAQKIKEKAAGEYPGDYSTQLYIIKEQVVAYKEIQ
ncbi:MAG: hypothetical protein K9K64_09195 [Desulfohalobiaceae bacterium]|nr:hypothetical protein [Desulfohalobiaceae bacterium]